jgi:hypothetical protein
VETTDWRSSAITSISTFNSARAPSSLSSRRTTDPLEKPVPVQSVDQTGERRDHQPIVSARVVLAAPRAAANNAARVLIIAGAKRVVSIR